MCFGFTLSLRLSTNRADIDIETLPNISEPVRVNVVMQHGVYKVHVVRGEPPKKHVSRAVTKSYPCSVPNYICRYPQVSEFGRLDSR